MVGRRRLVILAQGWSFSGSDRVDGSARDGRLASTPTTALVGDADLIADPA